MELHDNRGFLVFEPGGMPSVTFLDTISKHRGVRSHAQRITNSINFEIGAHFNLPVNLILLTTRHLEAES